MKEQKSKGKSNKQEIEIDFGKKNLAGYCYDEEMVLHRRHGQYHVERPERILCLYFRLSETGLLDKMTKVEVQEISDENILVHSKLFINKINDLVND